jgi:hypothetical protein
LVQKLHQVTYLAQRGLFARVGEQTGYDPSYVSRVAYGKRRNKTISHAIEGELKKMHNASCKTGQTPKNVREN